MWPLRAKMADARRAYLIDANGLFITIEEQHRKDAKKKEARPGSLEGQKHLAELLDTAENMAVWPFDRKTFVRFVSVLFVPWRLFLQKRLRGSLSVIREYFNSV